jgi:hypothetical protein
MNASRGDILLQAEKVTSLIATARRLMSDGKTVDLSNLEGKIRTLCNNAEDAGLGQPDAVRTVLGAIVEDLDLLEKEMTSHHPGGDGPSLETSIKRAIQAYHLDSEEN